MLCLCAARHTAHPTPTLKHLSPQPAPPQVASELGIPVELCPPSIHDLASFEAAFISSTSRLLLSVHQLDAPDMQPPASRQLPASEVATRLEAAVAAEIAACSEPLM
jgi:hypothetical protein